MGYATTIIPRWFTYYASSALFAVFGIKMIKEGKHTYLICHYLNTKPMSNPDTKPTCNPDTNPTCNPDTNPTCKLDTNPTCKPDTNPTCNPDTNPMSRQRH